MATLCAHLRRQRHVSFGAVVVTAVVVAVGGCGGSSKAHTTAGAAPARYAAPGTVRSRKRCMPAGGCRAGALRPQPRSRARLVGVDWNDTSSGAKAFAE
jgi:hypothetical protein